MPKIEKMLQMIVERNVSQVVMVSDRPLQIFANGNKAEGSITPSTQLLDIMSEIVPSSFAPVLHGGGKFQFRYASVYGQFDLSVDNFSGSLQVSITPARRTVVPPLQSPPVPKLQAPITPPPALEQSLTMPQRELYIAQNGQSIGPLSPEDAQQGVQSGQYKLHDMAIAPHMKTWDSLQNVLDYYGSKPVATVGAGSMMPATGNHHAIGSRSTLIRSFLNEEQDPDAVANVVDRLQGICTPDETILYIAVQKRPLINISCGSVALTTKRVIIFRPNTMGLGLNFEDFHWLYVENVHISEALLGSTFYVKMVNGFGGSLDSLPKAQARKLYQFGQQKEELVHKQRRELLLEEKRAGASNISMVNNMPAPQIAPAQFAPALQEVTEDPVAKLQKLKTMLEMNLISQVEYDSKRAEILSRL